MLAPIDKLKSHVNDIIQIVITTACTLECSNCTQLLPFRQDYRHMTIDCFRAAVESLRDWPGVIGMFGGNPCNHPKFPELCAILVELIPEQRRRGLWSNDLLMHGELCAKVFYPDGRFNLNAHGVQSAALKFKSFLPGKIIPGSEAGQASHATILADYRDFGMSDAEWRAARERCDINQKWSAAIVERSGQPFAYFCEVAAAIDGVRGINNGIPAVPGWWNETMDNAGFQQQVRACCDTGCGVPLKMTGHVDNANTYDITRSWGDQLKFTRGHRVADVITHDTKPGDVRENTDYMKVRS